MVIACQITWRSTFSSHSHHKNVRQYYQIEKVKWDYCDKTNENTEGLNKTETDVLLFIFQSNV